MDSPRPSMALLSAEALPSSPMAAPRRRREQRRCSPPHGFTSAVQGNNDKALSVPDDHLLGPPSGKSTFQGCCAATSPDSPRRKRLRRFPSHAQWNAFAKHRRRHPRSGFRLLGPCGGSGRANLALPMGAFHKRSDWAASRRSADQLLNVGTFCGTGAVISGELPRSRFFEIFWIQRPWRRSSEGT